MKSEVLCVVGMHRSGTSLVARIVNLLGVDLGPPDLLLPAAPDNLQGFWEHSPFTALNDAVLAAMGGTWDDPPALPEGWHRAPELRPLRGRARQLVRRHFGKSRRWGWKDPRSSLTLPFWSSVLPRMRYIVCLRNPVDVARSLEQRNAFPFPKGETLWLRYTQDALANTSAGERLLVCYEDLMTDTAPQLRRIAAFLGARPPRRRLAAARGPAPGAVNPALYHQRSPPADVFATSAVSFSSQALYAALGSQGLPADALNRFAGRCQETKSELERGREAEKRQEALRSELGVLREAVAGKERLLYVIRADLDRLTAEGDELHHSLAVREGEVSRLRDDLAARADRISELERSLEERAATVAELHAGLHEKAADLHHLRSALETTATAHIGARSALRVRDAEIARLQSTLRAITHSKAYPLLQTVWAVANVLAPVHSRRERIVNALFRAAGRAV